MVQSGKINIAVVQMKVHDGDPERNRHTARVHFDACIGGDLYLLPELWTSGYVQESWDFIARHDTPVTLEWMSCQAADRNIFLGGSVIALDADGYLVNRFLLFNRDGTRICCYDKAHLFKPMEETRYLRAGRELPPVVNVDGWRVSPAICYDLRFPEMFRRVALKGVDLFLVSSEWPEPREHVLRVLAEARAMENQALLALSNRIGVDGQGNRFCGGGGVFGPIGVLVDAKQTEGVTMVEVKLESIAGVRGFLEVFSDRIAGIDYE